MAEAAAAGDAYQVKIVGRMDGQETNNIWHFVAATASDDVLLRLVQVFIQCFITNLLPVLSSSWQMERVVWKKVHPTLGVENQYIPGGSLIGGGNANALPSFCSALFSIRTAQGGRSKRGRSFLAGIPEAVTTNSVLNAADPFWAAALAFAVCVLANFNPGDPPGANTWFPTVYSRKIGGSTFPFGANGFTRVTSISPVAQIATTRSRKVGRGA